MSKAVTPQQERLAAALNGFTRAAAELASLMVSELDPAQVDDVLTELESGGARIALSTTLVGTPVVFGYLTYAGAKPPRELFRLIPETSRAAMVH
jgi:hypothetical protein